MSFPGHFFSFSMTWREKNTDCVKKQEFLHELNSVQLRNETRSDWTLDVSTGQRRGEKAGNKPERVSSVSPAGASLWIGYSESLFRLERSRCCYSVARVKRSDKRHTKNNIVSQTLSGSHTHIRQTQMLFPLGDQPVSNLARDINSGQASKFSIYYIN